VSIAESIALVQSQIRAAEAAAARAPNSATLIAVSKTKPVSDIQQAMDAGQICFGENYAQEFRDKAKELDGARVGGQALDWHFIGSLQRNKVKYVVNKASLIHSVDSARLGQAISDRANGRQGILVSVTMGGEGSKSGVPIDQALGLCRELVEMPGLDLRGLMCIPPPEPGPWFKDLAELAAEGLRQGLPLSELSMGMSADFELAIAHGAKWVRVGSRLFGARG
jgi:pyridoxal phosphate enzyme (YggS family)